MKRFLLLVAVGLLAVACQPVLQPVANPPPATALPTQDAQLTDRATPEEEPAPTSEVEAKPAGQDSAANADVEFVRAVQEGSGTWTFHVTVRHLDTGWEDYADGWDIVLPDGTVVKPAPASRFTRLLLHPHQTEQPFTRSQSGIAIPVGVTTVLVRAHDLVDGWGGRTVTVDLAADSGADFEVQRRDAGSD